MKTKYKEPEKSEVFKFREQWLKKGYELIDITKLIELKLGESGWCHNFNEPEENCYHIKIYYRDEIIANIDGNRIYPIDEEKYCIFISGFKNDNDFIIFRKVRVRK